MGVSQRITIAEAKTRQRSLDFAEEFRHQFLLAKDPALIPKAWRRLELAGWHLGFGAAMPVHDILDAQGKPIGFLLGVAWNAAGTLQQRVARIPKTNQSTDIAATFENFALRLGGRYVALLLTEGDARLYGDPSSDLSWVYDSDLRAVGSTVSVLGSYPLNPNPEFRLRSLVNGYAVAAFEHTIDARIKRGRANHYLDLNTFELRRFWPNSEFALVSNEAEIDEACRKIAEKQARILRSLTAAFPCILPVTGGHDSRVLLACGTRFLGDFVEFCGYRFHNPSKRDTRLGSELVRGLGQDYEFYFTHGTTIGSLRDFRLRNGWACQRAELAALNCLEQYAQDHLVLRGGVVEMLRANQWRSDRLDRPPLARYGLKRLRLRDGDPDAIKTRWEPEFNAWLETLPEPAQHRSYDFMHVELWLPHTLGAYYQGFNRNFFMNPYNDRELIGWTASIPPTFRKTQNAVRKVIRAASPDVPVEVFT
ncbi:MAG: hypothetical protein AAGF88_04065 [Pseudomonadota bacterium]